MTIFIPKIKFLKSKSPNIQNKIGDNSTTNPDSTLFTETELVNNCFTDIQLVDIKISKTNSVVYVVGILVKSEYVLVDFLAEQFNEGLLLGMSVENKKLSGKFYFIKKGTKYLLTYENSKDYLDSLKNKNCDTKKQIKLNEEDLNIGELYSLDKYNVKQGVFLGMVYIANPKLVSDSVKYSNKKVPIFLPIKKSEDFKKKVNITLENPKTFLNLINIREFKSIYKLNGDSVDVSTDTLRNVLISAQKLAVDKLIRLEFIYKEDVSKSINKIPRSFVNSILKGKMFKLATLSETISRINVPRGLEIRTNTKYALNNYINSYLTK